MQKLSITLTLNGENVTVDCVANQTLLDVLRDELGLTGVKDACGGEENVVHAP